MYLQRIRLYPVAPDRMARAETGRADPGEHILEVEMTLEELAEILGEELSLPRIEPRARRTS